MHIRNTVYRAISTWNNNFVLGISRADNLFTIHLYDRILDQPQITLNMLRPSRRNPNISAHTIMEVNFDLNKTPLAPPVTKVIFHGKPNKRRTYRGSVPKNGEI